MNPLADIKLWQDLSQGERVRYNHESCPAGEDTRRRLYVQRSDTIPGLILGFCHNCGNDYKWRDSDNRKAIRFRSGDDITTPSHKQDQLIIPSNLCSLDDEPPVEAQVWLSNNPLMQTSADLFGIKYDPDSYRIYLPQYNRLRLDDRGYGVFDKQWGYQLRRLGHTGNKYISYRDSSDCQHTVIYEPWDDAGANFYTINVIVEDYLSGCAIATAGLLSTEYYVNAIVNYGTKINIEALADGAKKNVLNVVWLDNDSRAVEERAIEIKRTWQLVSDTPCKAFINARDPKHYSSEHLISTLRTLSKEYGRNDG